MRRLTATDALTDAIPQMSPAPPVDRIPTTMRAVRMVAPGRPVELQEIPVPTLGREDVLVRVRAAGICHSDVHYRAGRSRVEPLPLTLGHEVAGDVAAVGSGILWLRPGERVCLHYLLTCNDCVDCREGREQFCATGSMLGHFTDGGWAEYIAVPARNIVRLPESVPYEHGAVMMCSSATSLHALRKGRLAKGESVLVMGAGGLGQSAVQLASALDAGQVIAVDRDPARLELAERFGAVPVHAAGKSVEEIVAAVRYATHGRGVDVAVELVGHADTVQIALRSVAPLGRAVIVGLNDTPVPIDTYRDLIGREGELIGSNDHFLSEIEELCRLARAGLLVLDEVVTATVPLEAAAINAVLDALEQGRAPTRTVITP